MCFIVLLRGQREPSLNRVITEHIIELREQKRTRQQFDDLLQLLLEAHLQDPVGLIDDQTLKVLEHEPRSILKVETFLLEASRKVKNKQQLENISNSDECVEQAVLQDKLLVVEVQNLSASEVSEPRIQNTGRNVFPPRSPGGGPASGQVWPPGC